MSAKINYTWRYKEVTIPSEFVVGPEGIKAKSKFNVKPQDYDIKIPSVVRDKIANEIEVNIQSNYQLLNQ
ncbi:MAG: hypothetical protein IPN97_07790 [Saprospiraceae bacterium]|nr:hypothetical protein [Saprospiraceae bacterium]